MPYKSKAEREREEWRTLLDAVKHICNTEHITDEREARDQLRAALSDGLWPLKWLQDRRDPPPFGYSACPTPTDDPPRGRSWSTAKINWKTGRVRDDWDAYEPGKWRVLLIHRGIVTHLWPPHSSTKEDSPKPGKALPSFVAGKRGPKPELSERVKDAMRTGLREHKITASDLRNMKEEELAEHYGASRDTCRKARKVILSESEFVENS
jgi:hypothetical protein